MSLTRMAATGAAAALYILAAMPAWAGGGFEAELGASPEKVLDDVKITMRMAITTALLMGAGWCRI
jgi:hypothetical protein